jgi:carboxymethylenebutenolidase
MALKSKSRIFAVFAAIAVLASSLAVKAEGPKTEMVQFPGGRDGKETASGFLAVPEKPGRYPALIVIHEWWGLNDWVKEQTVKLASQGFVSLAVDLYRGKVASDAEEAHELSRALPNDRALLDLMAGIVYLAGRNDVDRGHVGTIGWGMGGNYAVQLAARLPRLSACAVNYGTLPTDPNELQNIGAPILGNFGADDHGITPADVRSFQKTMETLGRRVDIKIYDGAGHGFENPDNKQGYRPEAAQDAWNRTIVFLNKSLK